MTTDSSASTPLREVPADLARVLSADREARAQARALLSTASVQQLSEAALLELQHETVAARREWELIVATAAAEVDRRSAPELGAKGLARRNGHTHPGRFLAGITGGSRRDAHELIEAGRTVNEAEAHRQATEEAAAAGEPAPAPEAPVFPAVARALASGALSAAAAAMITRMLESMRGEATPERIAYAERRIVDKSPGLSVDQLAPIVRRFRDVLAAPAAEARQERLHDERHLIVTERRDGAVEFRGVLDPLSAAPLRAALDGGVKDAFRRRREQDRLSEDTRTAAQIRADALVSFASHMLGCEQAPLAHATTKVTVNVDLEALRSAVGVAEVEGGSPISIEQLRRMAVDAEYLPVVLGADSEPLDVGRASRRFTAAQRTGLVERDGGCAMCGAPPSHCEAHHIEWWDRDGGRTDLTNGVLLCVACHHTVHRGQWEIDASATEVFFRPPRSIDPKRRWRLGGRARFGVTRRERAELDAAGVPPPGTPSSVGHARGAEAPNRRGSQRLDDRDPARGPGRARTTDLTADAPRDEASARGSSRGSTHARGAARPHGTQDALL